VPNARCCAIRADGGACRGVPIRGSEWCAAHDPALQEQRRQGSRKGGRRGGRGRTGPAEVRKIQAEIRSVINDVIGGSLNKGTGSVAFMGYNTLLRSVEVERRLVEQAELEQRMLALESLLEQQHQGGMYGS
jgi:hypothetical protein